MSGNSKYSALEIENKRLLALRRKELAQKAQKSPSGSSPLTASPKNAERSRNENNGTRNPLVMQPQSQTNRYNPIPAKESKNFFSKQNVTQAKCAMVTDNRFSVDISAFQQQVIDLFKTIPSRSYDVTTRIWDFHINDYNSLMQKLSLLKPRVVVEGLPRAVLQIFQKDIVTDYSSYDISSIDPILLNSFMPFQREGVCYGISKDGRCIIGDDMGLGKTLQALGIADYYRSDWPLLIVSPSSVRYQWSSAIFNFLPSVPVQYVQHFANSNDRIGDAHVIIMSYDILKRAIASIEKHVFGVIIFDESHFVKSPKSGRTKAAACVAAQARRVILLSGTPALSRPMELYSQMTLIRPKFLGLHEFGIRYCAGALGKFGWEYGGSSNMQELQLLLKRCGLIRRLKSEVLTQLPSKIREVVVLDPKLIKAGTKAMTKMSDTLRSERLKGAQRNSALLQYYRETAVAKLPAIRNFVIDALDSGTKFLIFAHHAAVMNEICEAIDSKKIRYIRIDGSTKSEDRKTNCDLFQERDDYLVAVLSVTAANTGITLTAAQRVIFAELYWNPGTICQAEDRVHRIGQQSSVLIQFLIAETTADDHLWPLIQSKLNVLSQAGLGQSFPLEKTMGMKKQADKGQTNLCSWFMKTSIQPNCEENSTEENKTELSHLLEMDDEDLSALDLDMDV